MVRASFVSGGTAFWERELGLRARAIHDWPDYWETRDCLRLLTKVTGPAHVVPLSDSAREKHYMIYNFSDSIFLDFWILLSFILS